MPFLEIRRQTGISRTWIAALQRLPGKVVGLDRMFFDQPSEPIEQNLAQRGLALGEQGALARRDTQAEQQGRDAGQCPGEGRAEQVIEASQRLPPIGIAGAAQQQGSKVDTVETRQDMGKADETAERPVAVEPVAEIVVAPASSQIASVPERA